MTKITDWLMGFLVRFALASVAIALAVSFMMYCWVYEKRIALPSHLKAIMKRNSLIWAVVDIALLIILLRILS